MRNAGAVVLIIFYFGIYAFVHSFLASGLVKNKIASLSGRFFVFYRIFYNLIALWLLYILMEITPKPDIILFDLNYPYDIIVFALRVLTLAGLIWALSYINVKNFLGIEQVQNFFSRTESGDSYELIVKGPFKFSRHPVYLFSILFLLFSPYMSLFYFIFFICITTYFYIGSFYEEKKLIQQFGDAYIGYKNVVPRIFSLRAIKLILNNNPKTIL